MFLAYTAGMGGLVLVSAQLSAYVLKTFAAETRAISMQGDRKPSRVEKRLAQIEKARGRLPRQTRPQLLAYEVPDIHPAALAMAMDRAESAARHQTFADVRILNAHGSAVAGGDPETRDGDSPAVAGFAQYALAQDTATMASEADVSIEARGSGGEQLALTASSLRPPAAAPKAKAAKKKAIETLFGWGSPGDGVRVAETPGAIIQRQLGGTT